MTKISWKAEDVIVKDVSRRWSQKKKRSREYTVVKFASQSGFRLVDLAQNRNLRDFRVATALCFKEDIFLRLLPGRQATLSGFVSFGIGSVFLCIESFEYTDELGEDEKYKEEKEYLHLVSLFPGWINPFKAFPDLNCRTCLEYVSKNGTLSSFCRECDADRSDHNWNPET